MRILRVILVVFLWWIATGARAAAPPEGVLFDAASRGFQDRNFKYAETNFGDFVRLYPASDKIAEAMVWQAQARFELRNYDGVIDLLSTNLVRAGTHGDEFHYWIGQAQFQKGDYRGAAASYERLLSTYPGSSRRLEASVGRALSLYRANDLKGASELLSAPQGDFQQAATAKPGEEASVRGHLLQAEILQTLGDNAAGLAALKPLAGLILKPDALWQREYLTARLQLAGGQTNAALASLTNALDAAGLARSANLAATTHDLLGQVREGQGDFDAAIRSFTNNLLPAVPELLRRQALTKIFELNEARGRPDDTLRVYESFVEQRPQDPLLDQARMTIGELRLRQFRALPPAQRLAGLTNQLALALAQFDQVITNQTNSPLLGRARLQRGWCWWEEGQLRPESDRIAQAATEFETAAGQLPVSMDQAVARFKVADCYFMQQQFGRATTNYQRVIEQYATVPSAKEKLFDLARYQILRASLQLNDLPRATGVLKELLAAGPGSFYGDRGLLLVGQDLNRRGQSAAARELLQGYLNKQPDSPLAVEVRLAIARTYTQDKQWAPAAKEYDSLTTFPAATNLPPQIFLEHALLHFWAGNSSNAFPLFTNFLARFPSDTNAPLAWMWLGDYFFNQGQFVPAEQNYRQLADSTNWPPELTLPARMSAGRAAVARTGYKEAKEDFTRLIHDPRCPPELAAEAYFAYGDTLIEEAAADPAQPTNAFNAYAEAINAFERVRISVTNGATAARAWGKIGNCNLQLAGISNETNRYDAAARAYQAVMSSEFADIAARSEAEVGLGKVNERQGLLDKALENYSDVLYGKNLRAGEEADPFWLAQAGRGAVIVAEKKQDWRQLIALTDRLLASQPALRDILQPKRDKAQAQLALPETRQ